MLDNNTLAINKTKKKLINSISLAIWIVFGIVIFSAPTIVAAQLCHFLNLFTMNKQIQIIIFDKFSLVVSQSLELLVFRRMTETCDLTISGILSKKMANRKCSNCQMVPITRRI